jgi:hypothetical protein
MEHTSANFAGSDEPFVTLEEIARTLHLRADTLAIWARRYPSFPRLIIPGGRLRVRTSEVEAWLLSFEKDDDGEVAK